MATWPADLKSDQNIVFMPSPMPDQMQNLTNYKDAASKPGGPLDIIMLPMPAQIEDTMSHTWNKTKGLKASVLNMGKNLLVGAADKFSGGAASTYLDATGQHLDPHFFYTYQFSDPRTFNYSINMIPKNSGESSSIQKIVKIFKKYSSPTTQGGTFVKNFHWAIIPNNSAILDMTKFDKKAWALTNVTTNYTGAGSALFFDDGNPKQINLTLTFQEMETIYSEDW